MVKALEGTLVVSIKGGRSRSKMVDNIKKGKSDYGIKRLAGNREEWRAIMSRPAHGQNTTVFVI